LQGKVLFESNEGNGTTFYARFPLQIWFFLLDR